MLTAVPAATALSEYLVIVPLTAPASVEVSRLSRGTGTIVKDLPLQRRPIWYAPSFLGVYRDPIRATRADPHRPKVPRGGRTRTEEHLGCAKRTDAGDAMGVGP